MRLVCLYKQIEDGLFKSPSFCVTYNISRVTAVTAVSSIFLKQ